MYGVLTYISLILMVNLRKSYTIHGSYARQTMGSPPEKLESYSVKGFLRGGGDSPNLP